RRQGQEGLPDLRRQQGHVDERSRFRQGPLAELRRQEVERRNRAALQDARREGRLAGERTPRLSDRLQRAPVGACGNGKDLWVGSGSGRRRFFLRGSPGPPLEHQDSAGRARGGSSNAIRRSVAEMDVEGTNSACPFSFAALHWRRWFDSPEKTL